MVIVDDPMLALIMRFVSQGESLKTSDEEFMFRQVVAIGEYVGQFPPEEKSQRAMEWIERHAERYRQEWQRSVATRQFSNKRCPDCPLIANDSDSHCVIHERWQALLQSYADDEITSTEYVEDAMRLLEEHKAQLQVVLTTGSMSLSAGAEASK